METLLFAFFLPVASLCINFQSKKQKRKQKITIRSIFLIEYKFYYRSSSLLLKLFRHGFNICDGAMNSDEQKPSNRFGIHASIICCGSSGSDSSRRQCARVCHRPPVCQTAESRWASAAAATLVIRNHSRQSRRGWSHRADLQS